MWIVHRVYALKDAGYKHATKCHFASVLSFYQCLFRLWRFVSFVSTALLKWFQRGVAFSKVDWLG